MKADSVNRLRIATWNIRHGGGDRVALGDAVAALDADVVALTEFRHSERKADLQAELHSRGFTFALSSDPPEGKNGVLLVSREPLTRGPVDAPTFAPDRWVHGVTAAEVNIGAVYLPLNRSGVKVMFWEWLLAAADELANQSSVILGDFNTALKGLDSHIKMFGGEHLESLLERGWIDAFRSLHPSRELGSWWSHVGNGFRIDNAFLSANLAGQLEGAEYLTRAGESRLVKAPGDDAPGKALSDHAALTVTIKRYRQAKSARAS